MGVYVNLIQEISTRIETAVSAGLNIKQVQLFQKIETLQQNDMPYIAIIPQSIVENYGDRQIRGNKYSDLTITLDCLYPAFNRDGVNAIFEDNILGDNSNNIIGDAESKIIGADQAGFLVWLEQLLDALNTDSTGELNPQLDNSTTSMGIEVGEIVKNGSTISCTITLTLPSVAFSINNRQQI